MEEKEFLPEINDPIIKKEDPRVTRQVALLYWVLINTNFFTTDLTQEQKAEKDKLFYR